MTSLNRFLVLGAVCLFTLSRPVGAFSQEIETMTTPSTVLFPGLTEFAPQSMSPAETPEGTYNIRLEAKLTGDGAPLKHGLVWRVFDPTTDESGKMPLLAQSEGGEALFEFEPGEYLVHVAFGLAGVTKKLIVPVYAADNRDFILNAGGLVLDAVSGNDGRIPISKLSFSIYADERDDNEQRPLVIAKVKPNQIVRLNAGTYHVVSEYGNVNAVIRSDIRVEAGKLTEATIQHRAANLTLKLVAEEGGEAIADTAWSITNSAGDLISESVGAFPSLVLAEGQYTAIARHKDNLYRRDFQVVAGRDTDVEVILDQ